jgi:Tfp pilus assembly protein PilE
MAALAAIAVPFYLNYVNNARQETVDNMAESAAAAANAYYRKTNAAPENKDDLNIRMVDPDRFDIVVDAEKFEVTVTDGENSDISAVRSFR